MSLLKTFLAALSHSVLPLRPDVSLVHILVLVLLFLLLAERRHLTSLGESSGHPAGLLDPLRDALEPAAVPEYVEQPVGLTLARLRSLGEQRHLHKDNTNCLIRNLSSPFFDETPVGDEMVGVPQ